MYKERVMEDIDRAIAAEKKSSPGSIIFFAIAAILLAVNGYGLLFKGVGIKLLFGDAGMCGVMSWVMSIVCLIGIGYSIKRAIQTRAKDADVKFKEKYMSMVRAIGEEESVFAALDALDPIVCGSEELRFNQDLVACTSVDDLDKIYVYPISLMTNAGTGQQDDQDFLFMHFSVNGKKQKKSVYLPMEQAEAILQSLLQFNPNIKKGV